MTTETANARETKCQRERGDAVTDKQCLGARLINDKAVIYCDDAEGDSLQIHFGGNGDWYVSIRGKDWSGLFRTLSVRVCLSGSKQPRWFSALIAAIHTAVSGENDGAIRLLRSAIDSLSDDRAIKAEEETP